MSCHRNSIGRGDRAGYALLLGLLALLVIGLVVIYVRMHGPIYQIGKGKSDIEAPWRQWHQMHVRTKKGDPPGRPRAKQPQIPKSLQVIAKCEEEGQPRGTLEVVFLPEGKVYAVWSGQFFFKKKVDFQVMGSKSNGRIDPDRMYTDNQGDDPSRLFFITKGHFAILQTDDNTGQVRNLAGEMYVRGWLCLDRAVHGEIILTVDQKNFYLYTWKGKAEEGGLSLF